MFRSSKTSKASIYLDETSASLVGNSKNFITVDDRGITIRGPVSFVSDTGNRRTAGLFTGINDFLEMIPSTMVTPIPAKIPSPPVFAVTAIARDVAFFLSLLL